MINLDAVQAQAKAILPPGAYAFVAGGASGEWTLRGNRHAFGDHPILPRRLRGVDGATIDTSVHRRGIDVFRTLALGASTGGVGRPVLFGAALGGAGGVPSVLRHLRAELRPAMLLARVQAARDIGSDDLLPRPTKREEQP